MWREPETRSTLIGLAAVILFHVLLWASAPHLMKFEAIPAAPRPAPFAGRTGSHIAPRDLLVTNQLLQL